MKGDQTWEGEVRDAVVLGPLVIGELSSSPLLASHVLLSLFARYVSRGIRLGRVPLGVADTRPDCWSHGATGRHQQRNRETDDSIAAGSLGSERNVLGRARGVIAAGVVAFLPLAGYRKRLRQRIRRQL